MSRVPRIFYACVFLYIGCAGSVLAAELCPDKKVLGLVDANNIYVGEVHGTEQAALFIRCMLNRAINNRDRDIYLSLEMPADAENSRSSFWYGDDGRSSKSMSGLLVYAMMLEKSGKIKIHYQYGSVPIAEGIDKRIGKDLLELSVRNRVIALSGNNHARKSPLAGSTLQAPDPAGGYLDSTFKHILLAASTGGTAWVCISDICAEHEMPVSRSGRLPGEFIDGSDYGYDFVYFFDHYSSSPPLMTKEISDDNGKK